MSGLGTRSLWGQSMFIIFCAIYIMFAGFALSTLPSWMAFVLVFPIYIPFLFNRSFVFEPSQALMTKLFLVALVLFLLWPRYLAFQFSGPDITPHRLTHLTLILIWVVAVISPIFRSQLKESFKYHKGIIYLIITLIIVRFASAVFSEHPFQSIYSFINELMSVGLMFFITLSLFRDANAVEKIAKVLLFCGLLICFLSFYEYASKSIIFSQVHIPGMRLNSEYLLNALSDKSRGGSYRAQSTFSNPLVLAEFAVFLIPIAFYFFYRADGSLLKILGLISLLFLLVTAYCTGSRAGLAVAILMVGICSIFLVARMVTSKSMGGLGWFLLFAIIVAGIFGICYLAFGDVDLSYFQGRSLVERQSSEARLKMLTRGIPLILDRSLIGYGVAIGGVVLDFRGTNNMITVDNYYLSYALDSGLTGLVLFMAAMVSVVYIGVKNGMSNTSKEADLSMFISLSIVGLMIVMSIVSIDYIIPLLFITAAMILVLRKDSLSNLNKASKGVKNAF